MPPPPHTKPENVLKRAQELVGVGQAQAALNLLHEHVTSKRTRNSPLASIEPVMLLFIELGVDLKRGKNIKDGLYSYKNLSQNSSVQSLELVVTKYIELAEQKLAEAQAKAEEIQSGLESSNSTANVDDLEATETPESILLSTVSGEVSKDRTDRAIVTPCLKFLWETYRSVLDILKNNARLEILYSTVAQQAFSFCKKYERRTEFRRLCELLRNHLQNAAKYQSQIHAINLNDPDTLQRHLDTRFQQLSVGSALELWAEAFRSVEDIHMLLNLTKRPARNVTMATYFERLATIFSRSENHLFHAAAYNRYYNLLRASAHAVATGQGSKKDNPTVTDSDLSSCASFVILSALSIPVISTTRSRGALIDAADEQRKNKNQRLTSLLALSTPPTRASLLKEILRRGLLDRARPEIRELYNLLELSFHPLSICKKISPILSQIGSDPAMGKYVGPLQQVILTRLFQQLSQVYESVELSFVLGLAQFPEPFQVSSATVEKFIMNGCKKGDLAIRIDHATGIITFDSDVFSSAKALHPGASTGSADGEVSAVQTLQSTGSEIARSMLTRLAKTLYVTCQYVDPTFSEDQRKARAAALQRAEVGANKEHLETLERRAIIERKKQAASTALAQKEKEEATRKALRQQQAQAAETQRLETEQRERDQRRLREQQQRVQREEAEKQLAELKQGTKGLDLDDIDIDELDTGRIRAMKLAALEREKHELAERLRVTGKRIDHLERAMRLEQIKHLPADYEAQRQRDVEEYEAATAITLKDAEEKHKEELALKRQLSRLVPVYEKFRAQIRDQRAAEFERKRKTAQKELEQKKQQRIKEFRDRKAREQKEREDAERAAREEEERKVREAEEEAAKAEEKKRVDAERRAAREESQKKADEVAAKQRQREEEALQRRQERSTGVPDRSAPIERAPVESKAESGGPPKLALAGGKPSWREREAMKARGELQTSEAAPSPPAPAPIEPAAPAPAASAGTGGKYVPFHLRGAADGATQPPRGESMGDGWRGSSQRGREDGAGGSRLGVPRSGGPDRSVSPANGEGMGGRSFSGRGDAPPERTESPAAQPAAGGKYRPGMFKQGAGK